MRQCRVASPIALDVDRDRFKVTAVAGGILYAYEEEIPTMEIRYQVDDEGRKRTSIEVSDIALQCGLRSAFYKNLIRLSSKGAAFGLVLVLATQNPRPRCSTP